jgi:hypothetical protein
MGNGKTSVSHQKLKNYFNLIIVVEIFYGETDNREYASYDLLKLIPWINYPEAKLVMTVNGESEY